MIVLRDVELLKTIGVKDFDTFHDHMSFIDEKGEDLFGKALFNLKGKTLFSRNCIYTIITLSQVYF